METNQPVNSVTDFIANLQKEQTPTGLSDLVAPLFPTSASPTVGQPEQSTPSAGQLLQAAAPAPELTAPVALAPSPVSAPSADREQPVALTPDELPTTAGKRPLAHFGQAQPVAKSKANRKLVVQLTPEMYQYFAHVATLPGLDGVPLPDLALAILQAWREDYRPEIKKANAAFKA